MTSKITSGRGALPGKDFKDDAIHYPGLVVLVFLRMNCQYIQLTHSITKFLHVTAIMDINNKVMGFVSDRDEYLKPFVVVLQEQKAWDLLTANVISDETMTSSHYADEANVGKLWKSTSSKVEMNLPRMVVVMLVLVLFLLQQP